MDAGSQYTIIYTMYMGFIKFINHTLYLCVCNLSIYIVLCQGKDENILILDVHVQNATYVFASKGIQVAYLNLNLS